MKVTLKGIHGPIRSKGKEYWYAWRGGPRLKGEPGEPEFFASFNEAHAERHAPDESRFRSIILHYKNSEAWKQNSENTKTTWTRWLERIDDYFGELSIAAFRDTAKIQPIIRDWRYRWADRPRAADTGKQ